MHEFEVKGWLEAPRWGRPADFIEQLAMECGLDVSVRERKGLLRTSVYYTLKGTQARLRMFERIRDSALADYNREA